MLFIHILKGKKDDQKLCIEQGHSLNKNAQNG